MYVFVQYQKICLPQSWLRVFHLTLRHTEQTVLKKRSQKLQSPYKDCPLHLGHKFVAIMLNWYQEVHLIYWKDTIELNCIFFSNNNFPTSIESTVPEEFLLINLRNHSGSGITKPWYDKQTWRFLSILMHSWTTGILVSALDYELKSCTLLSSFLKMTFSILSQHHIFYQQFEIKLIHLHQFLVFWEICWEWCEPLNVTTWRTGFWIIMNCSQWMRLPEEFTVFTAFSYKNEFKDFL